MLFLIIIWFLSDIEEILFDSKYSTNFLWVLLSFLSWWVLYYGILKLQIITQKDEIHDYLSSKNQKIVRPKRK